MVDRGTVRPTLLGAARLWPTPTAHDSKGAGNLDRDLAREAALWPTPRADVSGSQLRGNDPKHGRGLEETARAKLWATPSASVPNDGESIESWERRRDGLRSRRINGNGLGEPTAIQAVRLGRQLRAKLNGGAPTSRSGLVLNPRFVEALMGFPIDWTALAPSEMPSSRTRARSSGDAYVPSQRRLDDAA
jgi:hypothetical protein